MKFSSAAPSFVGLSMARDRSVGNVAYFVLSLRNSDYEQNENETKLASSHPGIAHHMFSTWAQCLPANRHEQAPVIGFTKLGAQLVGAASSDHYITSEELGSPSIHWAPSRPTPPLSLPII